MADLYPAVMGINVNEISNLNLLKNHINKIHVDIMDNSFVPYTTQGSNLITQYAQTHHLYLWLHLMINDIHGFLSDYTFAEHTLVSFHIESKNDILSTIKTIKGKKYKAGLAINPKTDIKTTIPFLNIIDHILIMSVNPGASGQQFIPSVIAKIDFLISYQKLHNTFFTIGIDGGINSSNIAFLAQKGVQDFAISSAIFNQTDPLDAFKTLTAIINAY